VVGLDHDPTGPPTSFADRLRGRLEGWDAPGYGRYLRRLHEALDDEPRQPDVVITFNYLVTGGRLRRRHGVPVLTWLQNEVRTRHRAGLRELARTDGVLAVSGYIAERARHHYGSACPPVHLVPNGVNVERFTPPPAPCDPGRSHRSCFVGRIDPNKGPLLAVEAVDRAQQRGAELSVDVAGPVLAWGQDEGEVAAYVRRLDSALGRVRGRRLGLVARHDLPDFYRRHSIAFVPSVSPEPFGLVALEAMAAGCAVIASDRGGLPEVCGDAALLVDPTSPEQFDAALNRLTGDPEELDGRADLARRHAEQHTWTHTTDRLLEIVRCLT
jgi:glycosyltransferase involved in cell wall biosynthesis